MNDFWKKIKKKITTLSSQPQKEVNGSRNLIIFIAGSLGITIVLVVASLALYTADGTYQLDFSRPVFTPGRLKKIYRYFFSSHTVWIYIGSINTVF